MLGDYGKLKDAVTFEGFADRPIDLTLSRILIAQAASFEKNKYQYSFVQTIL
jgi:hypothetical protein